MIREEETSDVRGVNWKGYNERLYGLILYKREECLAKRGRTRKWGALEPSKANRLWSTSEISLGTSFAHKWTGKGKRISISGK